MAESMKLTKTPDGYVVQVPDDVVAALGLHDGDLVQVTKPGIVTIAVSEAERESAIDRMRALARPLPPDYKFDREEANAR